MVFSIVLVQLPGLGETIGLISHWWVAKLRLFTFWWENGDAIIQWHPAPHHLSRERARKNMTHVCHIKILVTINKCMRSEVTRVWETRCGTTRVLSVLRVIRIKLFILINVNLIPTAFPFPLPFLQCVPDSADTRFLSWNWNGNLPAFLRHFSEAHPLLVSPPRNSEQRPSSVMMLSTKMAAPVKRLIFFVFVPRLSF